MNFLRISFFVLLAITWSACGDDDAVEPCSQAAWRGTYTGIIDCNGSQEDVTLVISGSGLEAITIRYQTAINSTQIVDPITPDECVLDFTDQSGTMIFAELDGNNITYTEEVSGLFSSTCTITATKN